MAGNATPQNRRSPLWGALGSISFGFTPTKELAQAAEQNQLRMRLRVSFSRCLHQ